MESATLLAWQGSPNPSGPYSTWETAAQTIQAAVDAAQPGDTILVTNGVYATGGRAVYGLMTNRVVVDKAVMVQSVNGPEATVIQGRLSPGAAAGEGAIRCVYLTNGAVLSGFTFVQGASRESGDAGREMSGGGVWCESTNAIVTNCIVMWCAAANGGGACSGRLVQCVLTLNWAWNGGGAYSAVLDNCALTDNSVTYSGGGACYSTLNNCTLTENRAAVSGGGAYNSQLNYSIVYGNTSPIGTNHIGCRSSSCCSGWEPNTGAPYIDADPQLTNGWHISACSPCRSAGSAAFTTGTDIDGERWLAPPSVGCDEFWDSSAAGPLTAGLQSSRSIVPVGRGVDLAGLIRGHATLVTLDFGDGLIVTNQTRARHAWQAAGTYPVVLRAYNENHPDGVSATATVQVVVHYVSAACLNPQPPYAAWETAALTIQAAVDVAEPGALVLVTNGVYDTGGRAVNGRMTNRVAITKPVTVKSVNGPEFTVIQGRQAPGTTNGDGAVRCVYLAEGARLEGFTLALGATRAAGDSTLEQSGGGVWCASMNATVARCVVRACSAAAYGGGAYSGTLDGCALTGNWAGLGGGASCNGARNSSSIIGNWSSGPGGGACNDTLNNCTVTRNCSLSSGGGAWSGALNNSILFYNTARDSTNYCGGTLNYRCTTPLPAEGAGNVSEDPRLASFDHISSGPPCRGAGSALFASGTDLDGEPWLNPPSMGCDEIRPGGATGPLAGAIECSETRVLVRTAVTLTAWITGRATASAWDLGDGTVVSNRTSLDHAWAAPRNYRVVLRVWNDEAPGGVEVVQLIRVDPRPVHYVACDSANPVAPYSSWDTAARTIQEAVDAAQKGALVLVTNGSYAAGGRAISGTLTNRVGVDKPIEVRSINGPGVTWIIGSPGGAAVRCARLGNGALLSGFTLTNGATHTGGDPILEQSGGGVWCASTNVVVTHCVLAGNFAPNGGGAYSGTLKNCRIEGNRASSDGGGARQSVLVNCVVSGNLASASGGGTVDGAAWNCVYAGNSARDGGGAFRGTLNNCSLTGNSASAAGGGVCYSSANNCILYYNTALQGTNYSSASLNYCCADPLPGAGSGNINAAPRLASASRLGSGSPCRAAGGATFAWGVDLDGELWRDPPSIGCDEPGSAPLAGPLSVEVVSTRTIVLAGYPVGFAGSVAGAATASVWDLGDGAVASNMLCASHAWSQAGDYAVALRAFNESYPEGQSASVIIRVIERPVHHVWAAATNPVAPYATWETAAQTIQDAVDAASVPGALVLVSNGVYAAGGRAMYNFSLTNRVAVDKVLTVQSVNGPEATVIEGRQLRGYVRGNGAVRGVYLTNGAVLSGFTITNGATQDWGDLTHQRSGGGVLCDSTNAFVTNCVITGNSAVNGGGVAFGSVSRSVFRRNTALNDGGGALSCALESCALEGNSALYSGGGACRGTIDHCTLIENTSENGGGAVQAAVRNCVLYNNRATNGPDYWSSTLAFTCASPASGTGAGNIDADPQLTGPFHISAGSPCRGAGAAREGTGADIDGDPWLNPPSMGCDEYQEGPAAVALQAAIETPRLLVAAGMPVDLAARITGIASAIAWEFEDGAVTSNQFRVSHSWTAPGFYTVRLRAWNETDPEGVVASTTFEVQAPPVHYVWAGSGDPRPPYTNWATAAHVLQDAVDAAGPGALVLVTNGVYSSGGRAAFEYLTNRVCISLPVTVQSVNGPEVTVILV